MAAADVRSWPTTLEPNLTKVTTLDPGGHKQGGTHANRIDQRVNRIDQRATLTAADAPNLSTTIDPHLIPVTTLDRMDHKCRGTHVKRIDQRVTLTAGDAQNLSKNA